MLGTKNILYANKEVITFLLTENHWESSSTLSLYRNHGEVMPASITRSSSAKTRETESSHSYRASSKAASNTNKKSQIAASDDENRSEDDEVKDMTNQKLQSKGINSVKRQKTKTSDGEKASAPEKKRRRREGREGRRIERGERRRGGRG